MAERPANASATAFASQDFPEPLPPAMPSTTRGGIIEVSAIA
jgi:hypothetical protein